VIAEEVEVILPTADVDEVILCAEFFSTTLLSINQSYCFLLLFVHLFKKETVTTTVNVLITPEMEDLHEAQAGVIIAMLDTPGRRLHSLERGA
jgi:hypothetical protein